MRLLLALVALSALAAPAGAQAPAAPQAPPKPFTLEVEVDVVSVTAVVFDKSGKPLRGLGTKDVELLENGVKQQVSYFREASSQGDEADRVPLSVVLVLDTSGSSQSQGGDRRRAPRLETPEIESLRIREMRGRDVAQ